MSARISVIIPAAGSGTRMGSEIPKPYLLLADIPILSRTLRCFDIHDLVEKIIIAVSPEYRNLAENAVEVASISIPVVFVNGGSERMFSIANALSVVDDNTELVAVHDAVRPFVSKELILRLVSECRKSGASIPGLPVTDTIKVVDEFGKVTSTPDRNTLRSIQTPQVFHTSLLKNAYKLALGLKKFGTDDASLVEQYGAPISLVEGELDNIKLTYMSDIKRAEELLKNNPA